MSAEVTTREPGPGQAPLDLDGLNERFEGATAEALIRWAGARFGAGLALACSLGSEDVVLVDLVAEHAPETTVFTLDTGRLHQETYEVLDRLRGRYPQLRFEVYFPSGEAVEALLRQKGPQSFRQSVDDRRECCEIRKIEPLRRALRGRQAWLTGLRREQNVTRLGQRKIERDLLNGGIFKLSPLADWSHEDVWRAIRATEIPYNALHDQGFPSIGCAPCTRAVRPGEDERAGRWWWETPESKECGLHKRGDDDRQEK